MTTKEAILEILEYWHETNQGWWYGYDDLQDDIYWGCGISATLDEIKKTLQELKSEGKVKTETIYKEQNGLLNGKGWFYVAP